MKAKIMKLHRHTGRTRVVHVGFCVSVCDRIPTDLVKRAVQSLLLDAGASPRAIASVTASAVPTERRPA
jgi:hypothetical protein